MKRDDRDLDDLFYEEMAKNLIANGITDHSSARVTKIVGEAAQEMIDKSAPILALSLHKTAKKMLRHQRRQRRAFERNLRKHWGRALDIFMMTVVASEEFGSGYCDRQSDRAYEMGDHVFEALAHLHGRACRIALEIYTLLSHGFPMGAVARYRTLHEIAVNSIIISEFGRLPEYPDLAERFLLHDAVATYQDAERYQKDCEALGYSPLTQEEMDSRKKDFDTLVERFGRDYTKSYGWATPIFGHVPHFQKLEERAEISHFRSHYRWASHEVHSDSKSSSMNVVEFDGILVRRTGADNSGLNEPGNLTLISLQQCNTCLITGGNEDLSLQDALSLKAIEMLINDADQAFDAGQSSVIDAEQKLQIRLTNKRKRRFFSRP